jgi:uncharacterized YigZ family protein
LPISYLQKNQTSKFTFLNTILSDCESTYRDRGSKFYGFLFYCDSEESFKEKAEIIRKKYPDATHHCPAYRLHPENLTEFSSDDGEPSGTAGLPILNQLRSFDVVQVGAIIVRYYGGTHLGKPGLIEAYGSTTQRALENANLSEIKLVQIISIKYSYAHENEITQLYNTFSITELNAEYTSSIEKKIACPIEESAAVLSYLEQISYLPVDFEALEETYIKA